MMLCKEADLRFSLSLVMTSFNAGPSLVRNVDDVAILEGFMGRRGPLGLKDLDCFESAMTVVSNPCGVRRCRWLG